VLLLSVDRDNGGIAYLTAIRYSRQFGRNICSSYKFDFCFSSDIPFAKMTFILCTDNIRCVEGFSLYLSVIRIDDVSLPEEVFITTSSGSAREGIDFEGIRKMLYFEKGCRQINFDILIYRDEILEFPETFTVQLLQFPQQGIQGQLGNPNTCLVTIIDDNP
jgi:Calx-beta domain